jgi:hypothetical protein
MAAEQTKKVQVTAEEWTKRVRLTDWAGWTLLMVLAASFTVDVVTLSFLIGRLRGSTIPELIGLAVMTVFLSTVPLTVAFLFLAGLGYIDASDTIMKWLGGITIAELAGMATAMIAFYFKR